MAMARFETGPGGNPHTHGFSMGKPGPVVRRVKADVSGVDDLPPRTMTEDVRVVRKAMLREGGPMEWQYGDAWSRSMVLEKVEEVLVAEDDTQRIEGEEGLIGAEDAEIALNMFLALEITTSGGSTPRSSSALLAPSHTRSSG